MHPAFSPRRVSLIFAIFAELARSLRKPEFCEYCEWFSGFGVAILHGARTSIGKVIAFGPDDSLACRSTGWWPLSGL
jgi:hypothetical protein